MRTQKPLRAVTGKCPACGRKFETARRDQRFCGNACRQRAHRARKSLDDFDRQIEAARLHYWRLIYQAAVARGVAQTELISEQAQYVDADGNVFIGKMPDGRYAGNIGRPGNGWNSWGLEAAPPPWRGVPSVPPKKKNRTKPTP